MRTVKCYLGRAGLIADSDRACTEVVLTPTCRLPPAGAGSRREGISEFESHSGVGVEQPDGLDRVAVLLKYLQSR